MNPGGLVIVIVGVVIGCQVFGGHALERMGIVTASSGSSTGSTKPSVATSPLSTGLSPAVLPA